MSAKTPDNGPTCRRCSQPIAPSFTLCGECSIKWHVMISELSNQNPTPAQAKENWLAFLESKP